jgi:hypothetical protein
MLIVVWYRHPVLLPDSAEAGQLRGGILAISAVAGTSTARNPVESSMSSCTRGSRRKIACFTRLVS